MLCMLGMRNCAVQPAKCMQALLCHIWLAWATRIWSFGRGGSQLSVPCSSELPAAVKPARAAHAQWHAAVQGPAQEQHRQHLLRGRRGEPTHSQGCPDVRHVQVPGNGHGVLLCCPLASQELMGLPSQSQRAIQTPLGLRVSHTSTRCSAPAGLAPNELRIIFLRVIKCNSDDIMFNVWHRRRPRPAQDVMCRRGWRRSG